MFHGIIQIYVTHFTAVTQGTLSKYSQGLDITIPFHYKSNWYQLFEMLKFFYKTTCTQYKLYCDFERWVCPCKALLHAYLVYLIWVFDNPMQYKYQLSKESTILFKKAVSGYRPINWNICEKIQTQTTNKPDKTNYRQVSNMRRTLVGNKIVDHSDVVGASPVGAAPTTSSFST